MAKPTGIAKIEDTELPAAVAPADSHPAKGKQAADTGHDEEHDLPTAAEIAAELHAEPAASTDDDNDDDDEPAKPAAKADDDADDDDDEPTAEPAKLTADDAVAALADDSEILDTERAAAAAADTPPAKAGVEPGVKQRFDELTAARYAAEKETAGLREQIAAVNFEAPAFGPLALVDDLAALAKAEANDLALHKWALLHETDADGADLPDGKGGTRHFEPEEIRQIKVNTFEALYSHVPARKAFLQAKTAADAAALTAYPFLRSLTEGDGAEVQKLIEARPYLRQSPDYRTLAADAHMGAKLRKAGILLDDKALAALAKGKAPVAAAGVKPAAAAVAPIIRRTAPSPARPGVLPARLNGREAAARAADKALQTGGGSLASVADSIAAKMRF